MWQIRSIAGLSLLLVALSVPAMAQLDQGRFAGTVKDSSGGVIANTGVMINNEGTGDTRTVMSNSEGVYTANGLPAGKYGITMKAEGFAPAQFEHMALAVGQMRTIDVVLAPASVATVVTVDGGQLAEVDTSSARIGINVSEREVANLPLNGRQVSQLYLMAPGAVNYGAGTFDDIRFSGRAVEQNMVRTDGIESTGIIDASPSNFNGESTGLFRLQSSLENVQEFRVESNNYPAEYGTGTGGQISVVTKSGTNSFHSSLFEYVRNDALDARNFFDGADPSKLRLNQFGGSIGGPIKKDKAFFFAGYEGLRQRTSVPFVETTPSALAWDTVAVPSIKVLRPAFPVGQTPAPNGDPLVSVARYPGPGSVNENAGSIRLDYYLSDKYKFYARYNRDQGEALVTQNTTGSFYTETAVPQNLVLSVNQLLSPTMINETKFGFNGAKTRVNASAPDVPGLDLRGVTISLSGGGGVLSQPGEVGGGNLTGPTGQLRLSSALNGRGAPYTNYSMSFIDNLSVVHGDHSMKFGVEVRNPIKMFTSYLGGTTYSFSNLTSFLNNNPSTVSFNGDTTALSPFTGKSGETELTQSYYIFYGQDEWRMRPNFTINYGMRYEYYTPMHEANNKVVWFDTTNGTLTPNFTGDWYQMSKNNWGPRLAFSWSPDRMKGKTVLRLGAGYYYGPGQGEDQIQPAINDRVNRTITSGPLLSYPLDTNALIASYNINDPNLQFQPRAYTPGYKIPEQILQYTFSIQQQLPSSTVLTLAYVGSQGRNLFLRGISNKIIGVTTDPVTGAGTAIREFGNRFAEVDVKTSGGTDHYNALQMTLNRRFSRGLTMGAQYTWSHSIGNTDGSNEARTAANNFDFGAEHGNNASDVRHVFNINALYELPFGRGKKIGAGASPVVQALLGGWQLGTMINARTGLPIDVEIVRPDIVFFNPTTGLYSNSATAGVTTAVINVPGGGNSRNVRRPDLVLGVDPILHTSEKTQYINPAAFAVPKPGTYGNLARNSIYGPKVVQADLTLLKKFPFTERTNLEFRAEIYNLFNRSNFAAFPSSPGSGQVRLASAISPTLQPGQAYSVANAGANFGVFTSTVSNQVGFGTNRQIQLSLRLNF